MCGTPIECVPVVCTYANNRSVVQYEFMHFIFGLHNK